MLWLMKESKAHADSGGIIACLQPWPLFHFLFQESRCQVNPLTSSLAPE